MRRVAACWHIVENAGRPKLWRGAPERHFANLREQRTVTLDVLYCLYDGRYLSIRPCHGLLPQSCCKLACTRMSVCCAVTVHDPERSHVLPLCRSQRSMWPTSMKFKGTAAELLAGAVSKAEKLQRLRHWQRAARRRRRAGPGRLWQCTSRLCGTQIPNCSDQSQRPTALLAQQG